MEGFQSFVRFLTGFVAVIALSLGLTYAVNNYTTQQTAAAQQSAAFHALIQK